MSDTYQQETDGQQFDSIKELLLDHDMQVIEPVMSTLFDRLEYLEQALAQYQGRKQKLNSENDV